MEDGFTVALVATSVRDNIYRDTRDIISAETCFLMIDCHGGS